MKTPFAHGLTAFLAINAIVWVVLFTFFWALVATERGLGDLGGIVAVIAGAFAVPLGLLVGAHASLATFSGEVHRRPVIGMVSSIATAAATTLAVSWILGRGQSDPSRLVGLGVVTALATYAIAWYVALSLRARYLRRPPPDPSDD